MPRKIATGSLNIVNSGPEPNPQLDTSRRQTRRRWIIPAVLAVTTGLIGLVLWFGGVLPLNRDRMFRGKPESEWITNLKYNDSQQEAEWRAYGEEGVQVLIRGLENASRPGERAYRSFCRRIPYSFRRWLPSPKSDSTRSARVLLVSLLSSLACDATNAAPIMIRTANNDEYFGVRQTAIFYFVYNESYNCPINQLSPNQKKALLPALIRAIQDTNTSNWPMRWNATRALKYYSETREVTAPLLLKVLQDPEPRVRIEAAEGLNRVAPALARQNGATSILIGIAKHPDPAIAYRAVPALARSPSEPDLAIAALVESLQHTNTTIACSAVWALETLKGFDSYSDQIISGLRNAAQRKDSTGNYARFALERWDLKPGAKPGAK